MSLGNHNNYNQQVSTKWFVKNNNVDNDTESNKQPRFYDVVVKSVPGYTDDYGYYRIVINDHIFYRYQPIRKLGRGTYSDVIEAIDHKYKAKVAVKILRDVPSMPGDQEIFINEYLTAYYEDENIESVIKFYDHFTFRGHKFLVFDLLYCDLRQLLLTNTKGLFMHLVKDIVRSILCGLIRIHDASIIHNDIKTTNIMLTTPGESFIKIIDFGLSQIGIQDYKTKVQTRYYRSPEVLLEMSYGFKSDMWSVGCVAAELHLGNILFEGQNEAHQLGLIMQVLGKPPRKLVKQSPVHDKYFVTEQHPDYETAANSSSSYALTNAYTEYLDTIVPGTKTIQSVLDYSEPTFIDFLLKCLAWMPDERMDSREAVNHPWLCCGSPEVKVGPTITNIKRRLNLPVDATL